MSPDYLDRFGGVARLLGRGALSRLRDAHVAVVGLGGVGSWVVEALARSGIGALTLVDLDDVCVTNTNRQLPALAHTVGRPKVEVLAERVRAINPECAVTPVADFFSDRTAGALLEPAFSAVVDAIDDLGNKALLIARARALGRPVVTIGGGGGRRDAAQVLTGDLGDAFSDELLRQLRRKLRREHGYTPGTQKGRMHFGVRCVWSTEVRVYPRADGTCSPVPESTEAGRMDCETGLGSAVWVTGVLGLRAAQEAVELVLQRGGDGPATDVSSASR
jgi:tRNA threonylcarbamoyladenosine dehydratase